MPPPFPKVRYRSRVDPWLACLLAAASVLCAVVSVLVVLTRPVVEWPIAAAAILLGPALIGWIFFSTEYLLDDTTLVVRSGPMTWRIPLSKIRAVTSTRNPLSSPALSLDRLRIDWGARESVMISPREKQQFLDDLRKRGAQFDDGPVPPTRQN